LALERYSKPKPNQQRHSDGKTTTDPIVLLVARH
jgi:hypothetical protein